jgi:regulatory protein
VAVRALAHRDLSAHELAQRLGGRGIGKAERDAVVERLKQAGYVDDGRFAHGRAQVLANRGLGDEAIRADLDGRGLAADVVAEALAALEAEPDRARRESARLGGGVRAARTLVRKGFEPDSIDAALASAEGNG